MSPEEIKAVVRRFVEERWNNGKVDVIDEVCAPDYALLAFGGRKELKKAIADARAKSPDFHATVTDIIVEGDKVAYGWTMRGTGLGKTNVLDGITILRFAGGKIVEDRFISQERPAGT